MKLHCLTGIACLGLLTACQAANSALNAALGVDHEPLTANQERTIGATQRDKYLAAYGGPLASPGIQEYVNRVGQQLAKHSARKDVIWQFQVADSPAVAHFSLPGGFVIVTRGLLNTLQNEAQLAAVLAHEIGHVDAKHLAAEIDRQSQANARAGVAVRKSEEHMGVSEDLAEFDIDVVEAVEAVFPAKPDGGFGPRFGTEQELEVAETGVRLLHACNYRVSAVFKVADVLTTTEGVADVEALSTHETGERYKERVKDIINDNGTYDPRRGENGTEAYQAAVVAELERMS